MGGKVETADYLPYGHERKHAGDRVAFYKFTDQELDEETGLYNYGARLYDPILAKFITPDPYLSANITASISFSFEFTNKELIGRLINPQNLNRYAYVLNNPMKLFDPLGLEEKDAAKAYSHLHNGYKMPSVDIPWGTYGQGIADSSVQSCLAIHGHVSSWCPCCMARLLNRCQDNHRDN